MLFSIEVEVVDAPPLMVLLQVWLLL